MGFYSILTCQVKKWSNFVVEREHLFLRNISAIEELKVMGVDTTEKYSKNFKRLLNLFWLVETALEDEIESDELKDLWKKI